MNTLHEKVDLVENNSKKYSSVSLFVEPSISSGVKTAGLKFWKKEELATKSEEAIDNAMMAIRHMAQRIDSTIQSVDKHHKPDTVQVEFGLKFDGELDIIIARVGGEASIKVTLGWEQKNNSSP